MHSSMCLEQGCNFLGFGNVEGGAHDIDIFYNSHYSKYPDDLGKEWYYIGTWNVVVAMTFTNPLDGPISGGVMGCGGLMHP
jgi:hypothetical protein